MCPIAWGVNALLVVNHSCGVALPLEMPEEVLRQEIYTSARSPIDGKHLSAQEYALLQEELAVEITNGEASVSNEVKQLIQLLRLRQLLKKLSPF